MIGVMNDFMIINFLSLIYTRIWFLVYIYDLHFSVVFLVKFELALINFYVDY